MKKLIVFVALGLCIVAGWKLSRGSARAPGSEDFILIGEVGSLTGNEAAFGSSTHRGIVLAVEKANAAGGIHGKKLKLITLDDQGKPEETASAAAKLITHHRVVGLLGAVGSSKSLAMAPVAQKLGTPLVCPDATNPKVTELGDHIFRVCFTDPFQGQVMARFAMKNLGAKTAAILYDMKSDYSVGLADVFRKVFQSQGGKVVADQIYGAGDVDFKSQLTSIRTLAPDVLFVPGYYTEVGLIARQARELGMKLPLLGGDGWASPKLLEIGGPAVEGGYYSNSYSEESQRPEVKTFLSDFRAKYGSTPDDLAALGYDAAGVLIEAIRKVKSTEKALVRKALAETSGFAGVTGRITLDAHRNPIKSAVIIKIANQQFQYETTVDP